MNSTRIVGYVVGALVLILSLIIASDRYATDAEVATVEKGLEKQIGSTRELLEQRMGNIEKGVGRIEKKLDDVLERPRRHDRDQ